MANTWLDDILQSAQPTLAPYLTKKKEQPRMGVPTGGTTPESSTPPASQSAPQSTAPLPNIEYLGHQVLGSPQVANTVRANTGDLINLNAFMALPPEAQSYIMQNGVFEYNKWRVAYKPPTATQSLPAPAQTEEVPPNLPKPDQISIAKARALQGDLDLGMSSLPKTITDPDAQYAYRVISRFREGGVDLPSIPQDVGTTAQTDAWGLAMAKEYGKRGIPLPNNLLSFPLYVGSYNSGKNILTQTQPPQTAPTVPLNVLAPWLSPPKTKAEQISIAKAAALKGGVVDTGMSKLPKDITDDDAKSAYIVTSRWAEGGKGIPDISVPLGTSTAEMIAWANEMGREYARRGWTLPSNVASGLPAVVSAYNAEKALHAPAPSPVTESKPTPTQTAQLSQLAGIPLPTTAPTIETKTPSPVIEQQKADIAKIDADLARATDMGKNGEALPAGWKGYTTTEKSPMGRIKGTTYHESIYEVAYKKGQQIKADADAKAKAEAIVVAKAMADAEAARLKALERTAPVPASIPVNILAPWLKKPEVVMKPVARVEATPSWDMLAPDIIGQFNAKVDAYTKKIKDFELAQRGYLEKSAPVTAYYDDVSKYNDAVSKYNLDTKGKTFYENTPEWNQMLAREKELDDWRVRLDANKPLYDATSEYDRLNQQSIDLKKEGELIDSQRADAVNKAAQNAVALSNAQYENNLARAAASNQQAQRDKVAVIPTTALGWVNRFGLEINKAIHDTTPKFGAGGGQLPDDWQAAIVESWNENVKSMTPLIWIPDAVQGKMTPADIVASSLMDVAMIAPMFMVGGSSLKLGLKGMNVDRAALEGTLKSTKTNAVDKLAQTTGRDFATKFDAATLRLSEAIKSRDRAAIISAGNELRDIANTGKSSGALSPDYANEIIKQADGYRSNPTNVINQLDAADTKFLNDQSKIYQDWLAKNPNDPQSKYVRELLDLTTKQKNAKSTSTTRAELDSKIKSFDDKLWNDMFGDTKTRIEQVRVKELAKIEEVKAIESKRIAEEKVIADAKAKAEADARALEAKRIADEKARVDAENKRLAQVKLDADLVRAESYGKSGNALPVEWKGYTTTEKSSMGRIKSTTYHPSVYEIAYNKGKAVRDIELKKIADTEAAKRAEQAKVDAEIKAKADAEAKRIRDEAAAAQKKIDDAVRLDLEKKQVEAKRIADIETKRISEEKARIEELRLKADAEAKRIKVEADAENARIKVEAEAKAKAEADARAAEAKRLADIEAGKKAIIDAENKRLADIEAGKKAIADAEAKAKLDAEAKRLADARALEAKRIADEKAKVAVEQQRVAQEKINSDLARAEQYGKSGTPLPAELKGHTTVEKTAMGRVKSTTYHPSIYEKAYAKGNEVRVSELKMKEAEAKRISATEAAKKAEQVRIEAEAKAKVDAENARIKAEAEAKAKADANAIKLDLEAKQAEAKRLADIESKRIVEEKARIEELRLKTDAEAKRLADIEAGKKAITDAENKRLADIEETRKVEQAKIDAAIKSKAEAEAKRLADIEAGRKAIAEAEAKATETKRIAEERAKIVAEQQRIAQEQINADLEKAEAYGRSDTPLPPEFKGYTTVEKTGLGRVKSVTYRPSVYEIAYNKGKAARVAELKVKADIEAGKKVIADAEAKRLADIEAGKKVIADAEARRIKQEAEARAKAESEAVKLEFEAKQAEAKRIADAEVARIKEENARIEEVRLKDEATKKTEADTKAKIEADRIKVENDAKAAEVKRLIDLETEAKAKQAMVDAENKRLADLEAKLKADAEIKRLVDEKAAAAAEQQRIAQSKIDADLARATELGKKGEPLPVELKGYTTVEKTGLGRVKGTTYHESIYEKAYKVGKEAKVSELKLQDAEAKRLANIEAGKKVIADAEAKRLADIEAGKKAIADAEAKRIADAEAAKRVEQERIDSEIRAKADADAQRIKEDLDSKAKEEADNIERLKEQEVKTKAELEEAKRKLEEEKSKPSDEPYRPIEPSGGGTRVETYIEKAYDQRTGKTVEIERQRIVKEQAKVSTIEKVKTKAELDLEAKIKELEKRLKTETDARVKAAVDAMLKKMERKAKLAAEEQAKQKKIVEEEEKFDWSKIEEENRVREDKIYAEESAKERTRIAEELREKGAPETDAQRIEREALAKERETLAKEGVKESDATPRVSSIEAKEALKKSGDKLKADADKLAKIREAKAKARAEASARAAEKARLKAKAEIEALLKKLEPKETAKVSRIATKKVAPMPTKAEPKPITKTATKTGVKTKTSPKVTTTPQIKPDAKVTTKSDTKTVTESETKTETLPETRTSTRVSPAPIARPSPDTRISPTPEIYPSPYTMPHPSPAPSPEPLPHPTPEPTPHPTPEPAPRPMPHPMPVPEPTPTTETPTKITPKDIVRIRAGLPEKWAFLTDKQIASMVAWKQGIMYKSVFEPYGKDDIINTREAIEGVAYHEGIGSAAASAMARGIPPEVINRDMGIVDVRITSKVNAQGKAIPVLLFTADRSNYGAPKRGKHVARHAPRRNAGISIIR